MTKILGKVAAISFVALLLDGAWASSSEQAGTSVPEQVRQFASDLIDRVETTLDITAELESSREDIITVLRNDRSSASSWQLDLSPELMQDMPRSRVFDYLSYRAQLTVFCGGFFLRQFELRTLDLEFLDREVEERWSPRPQSESGLHMSWDCATLLDASGRPARIRSWEEFYEGLNVSSLVLENVPSFFPWGINMFADPPPWIGNDRAASIFRTNMEYLDEEYGEGPFEVLGFADEANLPTVRVYEQRVVNLNVYIGFDDRETRIVFVAPLSY